MTRPGILFYIEKSGIMAGNQDRKKHKQNGSLEEILYFSRRHP